MAIKQWYMLTAKISLQIITTWGVYYLARIPVQIVLLNEGYHYQTRSLFEVCKDHGRFPVPSVLLHRGLFILSVSYGLSVLILVWLLSFNPYAVLVAGQNLLEFLR